MKNFIEFLNESSWDKEYLPDLAETKKYLRETLKLHPAQIDKVLAMMMDNAKVERSLDEK